MHPRGHKRPQVFSQNPPLSTNSYSHLPVVNIGYLVPQLEIGSQPQWKVVGGSKRERGGEVFPLRHPSFYPDGSGRIPQMESTVAATVPVRMNYLVNTLYGLLRHIRSSGL